MKNQNEGHKGLLENPSVRRWYDNVARGSHVTADVYLRRLGNFCEIHKLDPKQLRSMGERKLENLLLDFVGKLEKQGKAGSYVGSILKAIKSWLAHNHRRIEVKIKIKGTKDAPSLKDERVPTKHELTRIFFSGNKKARVASAFVAHSGLRLETLGNYEGTDGLRIRDLPELSLDGGKVEFKRIPTMVVVRKELSKGGHQYFTFLSEEGCGYLKGYLEDRIKAKEELTPDSPIITPKLRMKPFVRTGNIGDAIRKAIRHAGFGWRPYVLRSYFDSWLMIAESKGHVIRDFRVFWMGHTGDIEALYTTRKRKLPEEIVKNMWEAYCKSQNYIQTTTPEAPSKEEGMEEAKKNLLLALGVKPEEINQMDLSNMESEKFITKIRQKIMENEEFLTKMAQKMRGGMANNGARQRVVLTGEIEKHIAQGWEFVATLPDGKAVIKLPSSSE